MERANFNKRDLLRAAIPGLLLCLASAGAFAANGTASAGLLAAESYNLTAQSVRAGSPQAAPYPLLPQEDHILDFDMAGSDERKLQLQLDQPLVLTTGSRTRMLDSGSDLLGLDAALAVPLSDEFSLFAGAGRQASVSRFRALGNIQCINGTLGPYSYTAYGCHFVDEAGTSARQTRFSLGGRFSTGPASASINWFTQAIGLDRSGAGNSSYLAPPVTMGRSLLTPDHSNPLLSAPGIDPLQYLSGSASGVDLNFKLGIATDRYGDVRLGLAFSRVLDAEYQGMYSGTPGGFAWTLAQPFNSATMNFEWSRGSISTGVQGFYRESVDFLNRDSVNGLTTFDVHFTWRAPWNADLSVGASNLLDAGPANAAGPKSQPVDPLESIYGRIPYVRYKQDL